jgi:2',3'-cyclic-nucleotide 2'-phosphodiesterase
VRILFVADVVGHPGREAVERLVPRLRDELELDLVVVNGENIADGRGITGRLADALFAAGADVVTLGNHTFARRGIGEYLEREPRIVRPANLLEGTPGRGLCVVPARDGTPVAVINLLGARFLEPAASPFEIVGPLVETAAQQAKVILVDIHAEVTSEKVAMGRHLAGRVTAVLGTHTHVQTNDAALLRGGTAYLTDAGMTGPHDSVIGVKTEIVLRRFLTQLPQKFETAEGDVRLEGALIECAAETGRATAIETFRRKL